MNAPYPNAQDYRLHEGQMSDNVNMDCISRQKYHRPLTESESGGHGKTAERTPLD